MTEGQTFQDTGEFGQQLGAGGMLISAPFVETPVGAGGFLASSAMYASSSLTVAVGLGLRWVGSATLAGQGDMNPLARTALATTQVVGEDMAHVPPLPFKTPGGLENLAGQDGCSP